MSLAQISQAEITGTVRPCNIIRQFLQRNGIPLFLIQSHQHPQHRFIRFGIDHRSAQLQRVYPLARGKNIPVKTQRIALVIIHNRIRKVQAISRILPQGIRYRHLHIFALQTDFRVLFHRGRKNELIVDIIQLHKLIKINIHPFRLKISRIRQWDLLHHLRRRLVFRSPLRITAVCTSIYAQRHHHDAKPFPLQYISSIPFHLAPFPIKSITAMIIATTKIII